MNLRSKWEFGEARECRRGLLCGMGINAVTGMNQKLPSVRKAAHLL